MRFYCIHIYLQFCLEILEYSPAKQKFPIIIHFKCWNYNSLYTAAKKNNKKKWIHNSRELFFLNIIENQLVEFEIFVTAYIIRGSLVAYQIGYVVERCPRRKFQTLIYWQSKDLGSNPSAVESVFFPQKDFQIL